MLNAFSPKDLIIFEKKVKPFLLLHLLLVSHVISLLAQDLPYPDYRTKRESFNKLTDKLLRADLASFAIGGLDESMGKLPLRKVPPSAYDRKSISFKDEKVEVKISTGPFDPKGKKILLAEEYVVKINNKPFYGSYGQLPKTAILEVKVLWGKDTVSIPATAFNDLFDPNFTYRDKNGVERTGCALYYSADGSRLYLYLLSRDDMGSYEVTWVVDKGVYARRVLDYNFTQ